MISRAAKCFLLLLAGIAVAEEPRLPNPAEAEVARKKAKTYAGEKDWKSARDEAERATWLDPQNADGWLILGTAEQRLDHPAAARDAFRKYLTFSPPEEKSAAVKTRLAQAEVAADQSERTEREAKQVKYGTDAQGFLLGFAPLYKPRIAGSEELNRRSSTALLLGYRMNQASQFLLRYQDGTIPNFSSSAPTTSVDAGVKLVAFEWEYGFVLNEPFEKFNGFQFFVPLSVQLFTNWVNGTPNVYMNFGFSFGTGVGVRYYTRSPVILDAVFVYHVAAPLADMESQSANDKALSPSGTPVKGDATGPEFRLTATIVW